MRASRVILIKIPRGFVCAFAHSLAAGSATVACLLCTPFP